MKEHQNTAFLKCIINNRGFTLVEVLIALLVLGILFVPVSNAFLQSVHVNQHLQQRVAAVREAQAAMEVTLSIMQEENDFEEELAEEIALQLAEEMAQQLSDFNSTGIIQPYTTVEIAALHEDSPFFVITATTPMTTADTHSAGSANSFTLATLRLPGKAPWLAPTEYRVVTP